MVRGRCTLGRNRKCHVGSRIFCCRAVIPFSTVAVMDEGLSCAGLFFSDNPLEFVGELDGNPEFRPFSPGDEQWKLGGLDASKIQVFWLLSHGRRKYVVKVVVVYIKHVFEIN